MSKQKLSYEGQNDIRYQIRQCGLRRENTRLRKSSFLRTNHIGLSIRPLYLRVRARTVLDKKKKGERKEGKSCIIIKLLRLTPMLNVIMLLISI